MRCERCFHSAPFNFEKSKQEKLSNQSKERVLALYWTLSRKSNNFSGIGIVEQERITLNGICNIQGVLVNVTLKIG